MEVGREEIRRRLDFAKIDSKEQIEAHAASCDQQHKHLTKSHR